MYKEIKVTIQGISPLLMHNIQLCDPFNAFTRAMKEITAKKTRKTEADIERLSELEFKGGLYVNADSRPILPSINLEGMLRDGGKNARLGKAFTAGVFVEHDALLNYNGPATADELWESPEHRSCMAVKVGQAKLMRTRCIFRDWGATFVIGYRADIVNEKQVTSALEYAGSTVGLMDYRPKFGRFTVK